MNDSKQKLISTKEKLDNVGAGMCLAKWTQTTIHLGLGHTHSCHHPRTHVIPIEEIKKNSGALHNTEYKKSIRKEMLEGKRPTECDYCWKVEDLNNDNLTSDRISKSSQPWSLPYIDDILTSSHDNDFDPKYLEISFSNVCNFKCSYCMPAVSSLWMEEIEKHGPYPTSMQYNNLSWVKTQNKMPIPLKEHNPYIDAFWDWFPRIYKNLHTFRITGGEPLLDKNTLRVLDYIIANPNPNLEFSINSNFCVPDKLFDKFLEKLDFVISNKLIKKALIYTSAESYGSHSEYIRYGMNYSQWKKNCYKFINKITPAHLGIMATYNALSVISFEEFLKDVYAMKKAAFNKTFLNTESTVFIDIPYLNNPLHQVVGLLTPDFLNLINSQISFMKNNQSNMYLGFKKVEIEKLERIRTMFSSYSENPIDNLTQHRKDFAIFVDEHDRRRGTNFIETFPEMKSFYELCKAL